MIGPMTVPPARVAVRLKPSGETSALEMTRSVTGPIISAKECRHAEARSRI